VKGYSFSIYAYLCSLFRQESSQRRAAVVADPNSAAPRSPAASQQFSKRSVSIKGVGLS